MDQPGKSGSCPLQKIPKTFHQSHKKWRINDFRKYFPKNAKTVVCPPEKSSLSKAKLSKKVSSLIVTIPTSERNQSDPHILGLLKPFKRFVKNIEGVSDSILPYFPNLREHELQLNNPFQKRIFFNLAYQKISLSSSSSFFNIFKKPARQTRFEEQMRLDLLRFLSRLKFLKALKINSDQRSQAFVFELAIQLQPSILQSLNQLSIHLSSTNQNINVQQIWPQEKLRFITDISIPADTCGWFFETVSLNHFQKLTKLEIWVSKDLFRLNNLVLLSQLKHLKMTIKTSSKKQIKDFLFHFSLPKMIETLRLDVSSVRWEKFIQKAQNENLTLFAQKWVGLERLKKLKFIVEEKEVSDKVNQNLVVPILKVLKNLEYVKYENKATTTDGSYPLKVKDLLESLGNSAQTIDRISLVNNKVSLEGINNAELQFPSLKLFQMTGDIYSCCNFPDLMRIFPLENTFFELDMDKLIIEDNETFNVMMKNLKSRTEQEKLVLCLDVEKVSSKLIVKEICDAYSKEINPGELDLTFYNVQNLNEVDLQLLKNGAEKNIFFSSLHLWEEEFDSKLLLEIE